MNNDDMCTLRQVADAQTFPGDWVPIDPDVHDCASLEALVLEDLIEVRGVHCRPTTEGRIAIFNGKVSEKRRSWVRRMLERLFGGG